MVPMSHFDGEKAQILEGLNTMIMRNQKTWSNDKQLINMYRNSVRELEEQ